MNTDSQTRRTFLASGDNRRWLITATGSDYESLMGFYENVDRETAMREFVRNHFESSTTWVMEVHEVGKPQKVEGHYDMQLRLKEF